MKEIFLGNTEEAIEILCEKRSQETRQWHLNFEHDVIIAFWLAIEKEN